MRDESDGANKAIREVMVVWTWLFASTRTMMEPRTHKRRAFVVEQLPRLPKDIQATFWEELREENECPLLVALLVASINVF